ncbi:MAG: hypothetical protein IKU11_01350 [Clostridia bacterium]|nr:hypothetical protein [Clostridia bacterium]
MDIFLGYLFTYLYVFLLLGVSTFLKSKYKVEGEVTRKIVHIGCGFSWFIMSRFFGATIHLLIPPLTFVALNYISYKKDTFSGMERSDKSSMGTVFYPVSMAILSGYVVFVDDKMLLPYGVALLCLSLGDGLAPIFGKIQKGNLPLIDGKTLWGTLTVLATSFLVILAMSLLYSVDYTIRDMALAAVFACVLELFGKRGFDNIFIPLGVAFLLYATAIL